jgi:hypothetical protein
MVPVLKFTLVKVELSVPQTSHFTVEKKKKKGSSSSHWIENLAGLKTTQKTLIKERVRQSMYNLVCRWVRVTILLWQSNSALLTHASLNNRINNKSASVEKQQCLVSVGVLHTSLPKTWNTHTLWSSRKMFDILFSVKQILIISIRFHKAHKQNLIKLLPGKTSLIRVHRRT